MVRKVETADPRSTLLAAAAQMRAGRRGALIVLDGRAIAGILTERDIVRAVADGRMPALTHVSEYMSQSPLTVPPTMDVAQAAALMRWHRIRHLPVADATGELLGLVSASGLLALHRWPLVVDVAEPW